MSIIVGEEKVMLNRNEPAGKFKSSNTLIASTQENIKIQTSDLIDALSEPKKPIKVFDKK
ncbi:hypothetical protein [Aliikangiella sp. IMCC44359]|uniref:hypothetical protein n=1 Tax=Aliikangiella sp. IMCC44359 TaxID=3459125 RepID=UPI00403AF666